MAGIGPSTRPLLLWSTEIAGVWITPTSRVRDLDVMVNPTSSRCYHIRQLRSIRRSLTVNTAHALAQALIHWLPFPDRIDFKLCVLAYKCLHDSAPVYISETCNLVSSFPGRSQLGSASAGNLIVPTIRTKTIGTRGFFYSCPSVWNSLPLNWKNAELTLPMFKNHLKTYFSQNTVSHCECLWGNLFQLVSHNPV